ncbi:MAG: hypothetical protein P1V19_08090 [Gimesia sp.]|nr:hypothetical protein [Gimesia sp.]
MAGFDELLPVSGPVAVVRRDGRRFVLVFDPQIDQVAVGFMDEFSGDNIARPRIDWRTGWRR